VAKGTFYHYFESKEDLLVQLADHQAEEMWARVEATPASKQGDPVGELRVLVGMIVAWQTGDARDLTATWLRVMYGQENLALRSRMADAFVRRLRPLVAELLAEGVAIGSFRIDDTDATTDVLLAMWRGMTDHLAEMLLASEGRPERIAEIISHLEAMETAAERMLGLDPQSFHIYDHERVAAALAGLTAPPGIPGAGEGERA
jgi:AcrR family transcriptional regulator